MNIVDLTSSYVMLFAFGASLKIFWNSWLVWREKNFELNSEKDAYQNILKVHSCAKDFYTEEKLKNSLLYDRTLSAFNVFQGKISRVLTLAILAFGVIPLTMNLFLQNYSVWMSVFLTTFLLAFFMCIISVPFEYYENFKLEAKFGFNTMTVKTFILDLLKSLFVLAIFSFIQTISVFFLLQACHTWYGKIDWKMCLALAFISSIAGIVLEVVQIRIIAPMFNKFSPMEDSPLKVRMEKMMKEFGFNPSGVFVIDASKRSKHSNAYCTGLGRNKRLVIYDTMLKNFTDDEIMAILGHELAHSKLHHIAIDKIVSFISIFAFFWIASFFIYDVSLYRAFGFNWVTAENVIVFSIVGFDLFGKIYESFSWVKDGFESWMSRIMEYAADRNSCKYNSWNIDPMITSLFKLYGENLSYPFNDSMYESWNFSHPGFINRINALKKLKNKKGENQ